MKLVENVTKLIHKTYGIGVFKTQYSEVAITVFFPIYGNKNFLLTAFHNGLLKIYEPEEKKYQKQSEKMIRNEKSIIQYDTSNLQIGEKNVLEAYASNKSLIFNESYTILGNEMKAANIYACYNLTVIGDLEVEKIEVKGTLTVIGNISATEVNCQNDLFCSGKVKVEGLEVGTDMIADSVNCKRFYCGGNAIIKTTIDIEDTKIEKVIVAGEGIIGGGDFSAQNAIAIEFFEYDGDIEGKVLEVNNEVSFRQECISEKSLENLSFEELIIKIKEMLTKEMVSSGDDSEECLLEFTKKLSEIDVMNVSDWFNVFSYVIDISYLEHIDNFRDYLFLVYAEQILPKEMIGYETVEHIFKQPFQEVSDMAHELEFTAKNVDEIMLALKIVTSYDSHLSISKEEALDKIFQSIGIKYDTVCSFLVVD